MMSEVQPQKESYIDEARRRIAHLSHKLEAAQDKIRKQAQGEAVSQRQTPVA